MKYKGIEIDIRQLMWVFIANGYHLDNIKRLSESNSILNIHKYDHLGAEVKYSVLLSDVQPSSDLIATLEKISKARGSCPICVAEKKNNNVKSFSPNELIGLLGGPVKSHLIFSDNLDNILSMLGVNKLPDGLEGCPDDLLEDCVKECLQYLLGHRAYRYGQDRRFESLPDGIALGKNNLIIQFDAKAYSNGYEISSDDIKRFSHYVTSFNDKYSSVLGKIHAFLIVTGKFKQGSIAIEKKRTEFYSRCGTHLALMGSQQLGSIVKFVRANHKYREAIDWKLVFSSKNVSKESIEKQVNNLSKDNLL